MRRSKRASDSVDFVATKPSGGVGRGMCYVWEITATQSRLPGLHVSIQCRLDEIGPTGRVKIFTNAGLSEISDHMRVATEYFSQ